MTFFSGRLSDDKYVWSWQGRPSGGKDEKKLKKDAKEGELEEKKQASHDLVSNILSSMPGNHGM